MAELATDLRRFLTNTWESFTSLKTANKVIVGGVLGCLAVREIVRLLSSTLKPSLADDPTNSKYDPEKIYLHIFPRDIVNNIPNFSPFVLRLETWLRWRGIKYEVGSILHSL